LRDAGYWAFISGPYELLLQPDDHGEVSRRLARDHLTRWMGSGGHHPHRTRSRLLLLVQIAYLEAMADEATGR
jgi:hypothetical protein